MSIEYEARQEQGKVRVRLGHGQVKVQARSGQLYGKVKARSM